MRLVAWNCAMALHRKADALLALEPDVAVVSECADPAILRARGAPAVLLDTAPIWIGDNPNKGLAVFTFNGFSARLDGAYLPYLRYIAPVHIEGPMRFRLLAAWAQNASAGTNRKHQLGPLRRSLGKYREFLDAHDVVVAGDLNNNVIWDRPGWRVNHVKVAEALAAMGLHSAYHAITGERPGAETAPTHYWRDRRKDGPTYHIDYIFAPGGWLDRVRHFSVGSFEDWCGNGLSDHVPLVLEVGDTTNREA